ncbi:GNAT family N-acetyltransferase [Propionibacteriaceae bacterium G57]|uniref:GNAT family N-acetyltransferase n=1 Tax=Aestuariimicrobium sp. G57 TaxID=3418485 RepID=UPI003DA79DD4
MTDAPKPHVPRTNTDHDVSIARVDDRHRYILSADGVEAGYIEFHERDGVSEMPHTIVDEAFGGRGYGMALAKFAFDDARERGLKVQPTCPFLDRYMKKHPEYEDLRA